MDWKRVACFVVYFFVCVFLFLEPSEGKFSFWLVVYGVRTPLSFYLHLSKQYKNILLLAASSSPTVMSAQGLKHPDCDNCDSCNEPPKPNHQRQEAGSLFPSFQADP